MLKKKYIKILKQSLIKKANVLFLYFNYKKINYIFKTEDDYFDNFFYNDELTINEYILKNIEFNQFLNIKKIKNSVMIYNIFLLKCIYKSKITENFFFNIDYFLLFLKSIKEEFNYLVILTLDDMNTVLVDDIEEYLNLNSLINFDYRIYLILTNSKLDIYNIKLNHFFNNKSTYMCYIMFIVQYYTLIFLLLVIFILNYINKKYNKFIIVKENFDYEYFNEYYDVYFYIKNIYILNNLILLF